MEEPIGLDFILDYKKLNKYASNIFLEREPPYDEIILLIKVDTMHKKNNKFEMLLAIEKFKEGYKYREKFRK